MKKVAVVYLIIVAVLVIGEVKCIIKAFSCNWEPVGKAEILYTGSAICGLGCITGYFDIEDK